MILIQSILFSPPTPLRKRGRKPVSFERLNHYKNVGQRYPNPCETGTLKKRFDSAEFLKIHNSSDLSVPVHMRFDLTLVALTDFHVPK